MWSSLLQRSPENLWGDSQKGLCPACQQQSLDSRDPKPSPPPACVSGKLQASYFSKTPLSHKEFVFYISIKSATHHLIWISHHKSFILSAFPLLQGKYWHHRKQLNWFQVHRDIGSCGMPLYPYLAPHSTELHPLAGLHCAHGTSLRRLHGTVSHLYPQDLTPLVLWLPATPAPWYTATVPRISTIYISKLVVIVHFWISDIFLEPLLRNMAQVWTAMQLVPVASSSSWVWKLGVPCVPLQDLSWPMCLETSGSTLTVAPLSPGTCVTSLWHSCGWHVSFSLVIFYLESHRDCHCSVQIFDCICEATWPCYHKMKFACRKLSWNTSDPLKTSIPLWI